MSEESVEVKQDKPPSTVNDFEVIKKIGKFHSLIMSLGDGAYSNVYRVKRLEDGGLYALKKVKMEKLSDKEKANAINEVRILASIKHPNVIQYKEAFIDDQS